MSDDESLDPPDWDTYDPDAAEEEAGRDAQASEEADAALERAILEIVRAPRYQPVKPRKIADRLGLTKDERVRVRRAVKQLVRRGLLYYEPNHLVRAATAEQPQTHTNRAVGTFRRNDAGFGFVRRKPASTGGPPPDDIYIPASAAGDASSGDTVLVEIGRSRERFGKLEGRIVEILQRQSHQFVGTYFEEGSAGYVQVDGTLFNRPIYVGDAGAKDAAPDDKVVFEMVRFPSAARDGEGVVTKVLGPRGQPGVDTQSIIHEYSLPGEFAEDALEEARLAAEAFDGTIGPERRDLTGLVVVTIDPPDARDFDDAISLERLPHGHWRLGVHIADVAHFVPAHTGLDREAYERGNSVYLPDRVIPMLPETVSNSLASLQAGKVRYTKTAFLEFTPEGVRTHCELLSSAIQSNRRLNYEEVDQFLADREPFRTEWGEEVVSLLGDMHALAMILRKRRFQRGALQMEMPEVKVDLDRKGRVSGAHVVPNTESHQIIEEFMLAANEAVAELIAQTGMPFLRRVHAPPDPRKLRMLTEFAHDLGFTVDSLESRFELQRLLDLSADRPERHAVHYAVLRSMTRAVYSPADEGHYALASDTYCHFTSPIRRYPDLTIHRMVDALIAGRKPRSDFDELVVAGEHCSETEQRADQAERELVRMKLLDYLSGRIGEEMDAVVTGVESFGLFLQGIELPAEGLVHVDALSDDFYRYDRRGHVLMGYRSGNRYRLGDKLRVAVARVDIERRQLDFRLVHRLRPEERKGRRKPPREGGPESGDGGGDRPRRKPGGRKPGKGDAPKPRAAKGRKKGGKRG